MLRILKVKRIALTCLLLAFAIPVLGQTLLGTNYAFVSTRISSLRVSPPLAYNYDPGAPGDLKVASNNDGFDANDYPPGMQFPDKTAAPKKPVNPFDMSKAPDAKEDDGVVDKVYNFFNIGKKISGWVVGSVESLILKTVRGAYKVVMRAVSKYVFQDLNLAKEARVIPIYKGFSWIVGAVFGLLIIVIGLKSILGVSFGYTDYKIKAMLPRIFLAAFCAIFALPLCQIFINMANSASLTILSLFNPSEGSPLQAVWSTLASSSVGPNTGVFMMILVIFLMIGLALLGVFYVIRKCALIVLAILAPLALALWIEDSTSEYTTLWAKAFFSLVFVEVIHALVITVFFQTVFATNDMLANLLYSFGLLYLMYKLPATLFQSTVIHWGPRPINTISMGAGALSGAKSFAGGG